MEKLKVQRSFKKAVLKRVQEFLDKTPLGSAELTLEACLTRQDMVNDAFLAIDKIQQEITKQETEVKEHEANEEYTIKVENLYLMVKERLLKLVTLLKVPVDIRPIGDDDERVLNNRSEVRLPPLSIPTFSGDFTDWTSFSDIFIGTVHSNKNLTDAQKLQYLKSVLKEEPLQLIKHFSITNTNYSEAWDKLVARYDKKKQIVYAHIKRFMEQSSVQIPSSVKIRQLLNTSDEAIRALKALECESRDPWILYVLISKLDDESKTLWFQQSVATDSPTLIKFFEFLEERSYSLESIQSSNTKSSNSLKVHHSSDEQSIENTVHSKEPQMSTSNPWNQKCPVCNNSHPIWRCFAFKKWSSESRCDFAKTNKLCGNCLDNSHTINECTRSTSCYHCGDRHHSLLHMFKNGCSEPTLSSSTPTSNTSNSSSQQISSMPASLSSFNSTSSHLIDIVPTAVVYAKDISGEKQLVRVMIDTGSESCLISEDCIKKLGIPRKSADIKLNGLSAKEVGAANGLSTVELSSRFNEDDKIAIDCLILDILTTDIPSNHFKVPESYRINEIQQLADPDFNKPSKIDIMIGFRKFLLILGSEKLLDLDGTPIALSSMFGFLMSGERLLQPTDVSLNSSSLEETLKQFWELKDTQALIPQSDKEKACETSAAPYYLQQLETAEVIKKDVDVYDLASGHNELNQCIMLQKEVNEVLEKGGLHLGKLASKNNQIVANIPQENRITDLKNLSESLEIKTLETYWKQPPDYCSFKINLISEIQMFTKRSFLSDFVKLFHYLGWLAPVVVVSKIICQKLWLWTIVVADPAEMLSMVSWYTNLIRITAWCLRFMYKCKSTNPSHFGFLKTAELQNAVNVYFKWIQQNEYSTELQLCTLMTPLPFKNPLILLYPFLDENGIVRVDGRLEDAGCSYSFTHHIIYYS